MKVNELTIGCWVHSPIHGNVKVQSIVAFDGVSHDLSYHVYYDQLRHDSVNNVEPIPLTEPMLFNNGIDKKRTVRQSDWYGYIDYYYKNKAVISLSEEPNSTLGYVHSFQQRLISQYGLDELAENFIVE